MLIRFPGMGWSDMGMCLYPWSNQPCWVHAGTIRCMAGEWAADVDTSPEVVRRLLTSQFPQYSGSSLELLGEGWDNTAYLVDGQLVFRFPRRRSAAPLIYNEARMLPYLAPLVPIRIPVPVLVGEPQGDYPYPFLAYEHLPGSTACSVRFTTEERENLAEPLAEFLATLHNLPVPPDAPEEGLGKTDLPRRLALFQDRLTQISPFLGQRAENVTREVERLADTPPIPEEDCLVHGDLYARHVLVGEDRALCGVIDWGDVCLGSRELDLSVAVSMLTQRGLDRFKDLYGSVSEAAWARARFRALFYGIVLIHYGLSQGEQALVETGEFCLTSALDT
jgi:aminoglycoside phosphotransferase (APT) family kinase protein